MSNIKNKEAALLKDLAQVCLDSQEGYAKAAEAVRDQSLKSMFLVLSDKREKFAKEIQILQENIAEDATESGSISAKVHQGWINLKQLLPGIDDQSILAECERGDEHALSAYEDIEDTLVHPNARDIILKHRAHILGTLSEIRRFKD